MEKILIKTIVMYVVSLTAVRMLGKRQIGEFEPSELVVTIIISEVAAAPILDKKVPIYEMLFVISLIILFEISVSFFAFKSPFFRKFLYGTPSVFFEKGRLFEKEMKKQRFSITDLMQAVRENGFTNLSEIDYIIMETDGNISVLPKDSEKEPSKESFISYVIIDDKTVLFNNLKRIKKDEKWLKDELKKKGVKSYDKVFLFLADEDGNTFLIKKEDKNRKG